MKTNKLPNQSSPYKSLFTSFSLGSRTLKNRIISTSHAPANAEDGMPKERYQKYHEEKAKGGLSLTMFGGTSSVSQDSPASFGQLDASSDRIIPYFKSFSKRIHAYDVGIICQLGHAGRRIRLTSGSWLPTVAPSAILELSLLCSFKLEIVYRLGVFMPLSWTLHAFVSTFKLSLVIMNWHSRKNNTFSDVSRRVNSKLNDE